MRIIPVLAAALFLTAAAAAPVPEPSGLWQGAMHGDTPNTLKGATVIDTKALADMIRREKPLLLDVVDQDKKSASTSTDIPWMPTHRSIPGAVWLAGAGSGTSDPAFTAAFKTRIAALTGGDIKKPIVAFCHPHCWGSWNAAKRLVILGYKHVYWYPDGVEGWQSQDDTKIVRPDPAWEKALSPGKPTRSKPIREG